MPVSFDKKTNRYRAADGRFISPRRVRREVDKTVEIVRKDFRALGSALANKSISVVEFHIQMEKQLRIAHSLTAAIGRGGRKAMTAKDWGAVGNDLKKEYGYLNKFVRDIEQGKVSPARLEARAANYAAGLRSGYYNSMTKGELAAGKSLVRRVINSKEGCAECASYTDFIPIDDMPGIGELECQNRCLCELEFAD